MTVPDAMPATTAAVLAAVIRLHGERGHVAIRDIQRLGLQGMSSLSTVHAHLRKLRALGLVAWDSGRDGTLRPTVTVHAPGKPGAMAALGALMASVMPDPDDTDNCEADMAALRDAT